jgi:hypothetical protein
MPIPRPLIGILYIAVNEGGVVRPFFRSLAWSGDKPHQDALSFNGHLFTLEGKIEQLEEMLSGFRGGKLFHNYVQCTSVHGFVKGLK